MKTSTFKLTISCCLFCLPFFSFSQYFPNKTIYLDTLAKRQIESLKHRGIDNYIIYSVANLLKEGIKNDSCDGKRVLYILWERNSVGFIKKYTECYDYLIDVIDIGKVKDSIIKYEKKLIAENDSTNYYINKNSFYNGDYCKSKHHNKITYEIVSNINHNIIRIFGDDDDNKHNYLLVEQLNKLICESNINYKKTKKIVFDSVFTNAIRNLNNEKSNFTLELMKEWINSSVPIDENSLKKESSLIQEVYKLYDYLLLQKQFIDGSNIDYKVKYFWVPSIEIGQYESNDTKSYSGFKNLKTMKLANFRPKENYKAEKFLYTNNKIVNYFKNEYCKYGPLPDVYYNVIQQKCGLKKVYESPPAIRIIYFNKDFSEAFITFDISNKHRMLILKKETEDWKTLVDLGETPLD